MSATTAGPETDAEIRQLRLRTEILLMIRDLNEDELEVVRLVVEGAIKGREVYGPLRVANENRDMADEAMQEVRDGLFYLATQMVRARRG